jgi:hypothetical protein
MSQPRDFDPASLLLGYTAGELSPAEERRLLEAAAADQDLFDHLVEADAVRHALSDPEERLRAGAVLKAWEVQSTVPSATRQHARPAIPLPGPDLPEAALRGAAPRHTPILLADFLRSLGSTIATALALRLCYAIITSVGSSLVLPQVQPGQTPPVPSILHLVHAAIAALLLAIQFTPLLKPQAIAEQDHPIARKCLAQFIAGWQWTWVAWLALYCWLWIHPSAGGSPDIVADILNCLTAFPLFWCFFVLDKPSVAVHGNPGRTAAFRKAIGTTWGIGAGVVLLAVAGRLHLWGLNEFGLVFLGIYDGLAIAFLVGRFDSHWMKVPRWMLAPLYGYALIQMIYVFFFALPPAWQIYTYLVALLFKVCLFVFVTLLLHAGNLRRYLEAAEDGNLGPPADGG